MKQRKREKRRSVIEAPYCNMCTSRTEKCVEINSENIKKFQQYTEKFFYENFIQYINGNINTIEITIPFVPVRPVGKDKECRISYECDRKVKVANVLFKTEGIYCSYFQYYVFVSEIIRLFEKNKFRLDSNSNKEKLFYVKKRFVFKRELE